MNNLFITKVVKSGNSLAVVLPKEILSAMMLERGDTVSFGVLEGPTLVMRQVSEQELQRLKPVRNINY